MSTALPVPSKHIINLTSTAETIKFFHKPSYLLLTTTGTLFVSEILIMVLIKYLPPLPPLQEREHGDYVCMTFCSIYY